MRVYAHTDYRHKLKQLILYVSEQLRDAEYFGTTKLNKILYNAEAAAYREEGITISGNRFKYQKNHHGPTLLAFPPIIREMLEEQLLTLSASTVEGEDRPEARRPADPSVFTRREREIIDHEIERLRHSTGREARLASHQTAAWYATKLHSPIDWNLAFVEEPGVEVALSDDEITRAHAAAERFLGRTREN